MGGGLALRVKGHSAIPVLNTLLNKLSVVQVLPWGKTEKTRFLCVCLNIMD